MLLKVYSCTEKSNNGDFSSIYGNYSTHTKKVDIRARIRIRPKRSGSRSSTHVLRRQHFKLNFFHRKLFLSIIKPFVMCYNVGTVSISFSQTRIINTMFNKSHVWGFGSVRLYYLFLLKTTYTVPVRITLRFIQSTVVLLQFYIYTIYIYNK
jgi:hypothetical protein